MKLTSLLSLALICITAPASFAQVATTRIAVVNPNRVLQEMKERQDWMATLEQDRARIKAQEDERKLELQKLQSQRDQLKSDSPQWDELNTKLGDAVADFQAWVQKTKLKVDRNQKKQFLQLFESLQAAVGEVAKRDGFDVVISDQHPQINNIDQINMEQLSGLLGARSVLYAAPKSDISEAVIQQVNAAYKTKGGAASGASSTPAPTRKPAAPAPAPAAPAPAPKQ